MFAKLPDCRYTEDCTISDVKALLQRHVSVEDADPKFMAPPSFK